MYVRELNEHFLRRRDKQGQRERDRETERVVET